MSNNLPIFVRYNHSSSFPSARSEFCCQDRAVREGFAFVTLDENCRALMHGYGYHTVPDLIECGFAAATQLDYALTGITEQQLRKQFRYC